MTGNFTYEELNTEIRKAIPQFPGFMPGPQGLCLCLYTPTGEIIIDMMEWRDDLTYMVALCMEHIRHKLDLYLRLYIPGDYA